MPDYQQEVAFRSSSHDKHRFQHPTLGPWPGSAPCRLCVVGDFSYYIFHQSWNTPAKAGRTFRPKPTVLSELKDVPVVSSFVFPSSRKLTAMRSFSCSVGTTGLFPICMRRSLHRLRHAHCTNTSCSTALSVRKPAFDANSTSRRRCQIPCITARIRCSQQQASSIPSASRLQKSALLLLFKQGNNAHVQSHSFHTLPNLHGLKQIQSLYKPQPRTKF